LRSKTKRSVAYELMEWNVDDGIPKPKVQCAAQGRLTEVTPVKFASMAVTRSSGRVLTKLSELSTSIQGLEQDAAFPNPS
jgi:hypothetical protein